MLMFVHGIRLTTGMQLIPSSSVTSGLSNCRAFTLIRGHVIIHERQKKSLIWQSDEKMLHFC
jgi:hypothetical protein